VTDSRESAAVNDAAAMRRSQVLVNQLLADAEVSSDVPFALAGGDRRWRSLH
jgi:hypothetical protein